MWNSFETSFTMLVNHFIFVTLFHCILTVQNKSAKNGGFLFSMPKQLIAGDNAVTCISLHDTTLPVKALIDIKHKSKHYPTSKTLESESTCFALLVPNITVKEPQIVSVRIQVQLNGVIQSAHSQDAIILYAKKPRTTFIETDRNLYKPGDTIKFRILVLDDRILPVHDSERIDEVRIKNPFDVTVQIWANLATNYGLVQLEYETVVECLTGEWKIEVNGFTKHFHLFKHVVPHFKVTLAHPKVIYFESKVIEVNVCGEYSWGKKVNGLALLKFSQALKSDLTLSKQLDAFGCSRFKVKTSDLGLQNVAEKFKMYDPKIELQMVASITEKGTNKVEMAEASVVVSMKAFDLRVKGDASFRPGLAYRGKVELSNLKASLDNEVIEICYNIAIKKSWNYLNNESCKNFSVSGSGTTDFSILPMKSNVIHVHIKTRSLNHTNIGDSLLVVRLFSPSNSYVYFEESNSEIVDCQNHHQFPVTFTTDQFEAGDNVTFYYIIKTANELVRLKKLNVTVKKSAIIKNGDLKNVLGTKSKFTKVSAFQTFILHVKLGRTFYDKYNLLIYYIASNGETIAAMKSISATSCLLKVNAKWERSRIVPGDSATLHISTNSPALCAVAAVDAATSFVTNNINYLNQKKLLDAFEVQDEENGQQAARKVSCIAPNKKAEVSSFILPPMEELRRRRHVYSFSEDFDAYDVFNKFGTVVISNLKLVTKSCYNGPLLKDFRDVQFMTNNNHYEEENEDKRVDFRYDFPATWLWELVLVENGQVEVSRDAPHSITNWLTNVMCVSQKDGVGFAKEIQLNAFQSFFVDVLTPYSIKMGEIFHLQVNVFNYLDYNLPIRLAINLSPGLKISESTKHTISYCVQKNSTTTHAFPISGSAIGNANLTIFAEVDNQYPAYCGPETVIDKRDVVFKTLLVEPEGYQVKNTKSVLFCTSSGNSKNTSWDLLVPDDAVPGTGMAFFTINGDLLGQTIQNLNDLLDIPSGCGEQIMASVAPNLYVLRYLTATNNLTPSIRQRIYRHLKIGYQKILNYVHKDGSFSAFGYHDPSGSMFLTVFVVRTLQEAKQYIYIDQRVIDKAVAWIFNHQLENGCFNTMHHVFQDMGGTSKENSTASLTAYVLISLSEAGIAVPKSVQTNAKYCIRSQHNPNKYTMAISCYALFKVNWQREALRVLERLLSVAQQEQNMMWWNESDGNSTSATDLEISSYVLLALLQSNTTENLAKANSIVQWLSLQFGPKGGFKSTQDTVVTLDALGKYATIITAQKLNLQITLELKRLKQQFDMREKDRLKSTIIQVPEINSNAKITIKGEGCILAQSVVSYYLKEIPRSEAFKLALEVSAVSNIDQCSVASLSPCLAYNGPDSLANMAVLEVNLPSGYIADRASLFKLLNNESESKVKKFEEIRDQVFLYFTKLNKQEVCISFNINENALVEGRKDTAIKLYDYYKPEYESLQFYTINQCSFNDSLVIPTIIVKPSSKIQHDLLNATTDIRKKRQINPDFVDLNVEMQVPDGIEGNTPRFIKTKFNYKKKATKTNN